MANDGVVSREAELTPVLKALFHECHAILALSEDEIRESAGHTNLHVFKRHIAAAEAVLQRTEPCQTPA